VLRDPPLQALLVTLGSLLMMDALCGVPFVFTSIRSVEGIIVTLCDIPHIFEMKKTFSPFVLSFFAQKIHH